MNINEQELKKTLDHLEQIKIYITTSDHERIANCEEYEPSGDELIAWHDQLKLPLPIDAVGANVHELPEEYWTDIFEDFEMSLEEYEEMKTTKEYKTLFNLYSTVYSVMYEAARESGAYYEMEWIEEEEEHDSMRGHV